MAVYLRWLIAAAALSIVVVLSAGCSDSRTQGGAPAAGPEVAEREKRFQIISQEKEFEIFKITNAKEGDACYVVRVFDDVKKAVYEQQIPKKGEYLPRVKLFNDGLNDSMIEIRQYESERVWVSNYYDRKRNRVSPVYANVLSSGYGKVVFSTPGKIIVTDTFDKDTFYKEFIVDDLVAETKPADAFLDILWAGQEGLSVTYAVKRGELLTDKTVFLALTAAAAKAREMQRIDDSWRLVERTKEYQVFTGFDNTIGHAMYVVMVYDDQGNVVHVSSYPVSRMAPSVTMLDNDIVKMTLGVGTGAKYTHYYDRKNRRKSPVYYSPLLVGHGKVVSPKIGKLVVSDMFGEGLFYKELIIVDFPPVANPVDAFGEIKWVDENRLSVTHWVGKKGEKSGRKTIVFDLNE